MSELRLIVREAECDWSGTIDGGSADRAIAALSADPVTLDELEIAMARFAKPTPGRRFFANLTPQLYDEPYDAGLVVIDLIARLVVVDSTYSSPSAAGSAAYHDGQSCTDEQLSYHLASDWHFSNDRLHWRGIAENRRQERAAKLVIDARAVFYGRPMLEFIARGVFAKFSDGAAQTADAEDSDNQSREAVRQIHADWMLTPRDDLGGACPREVAVARRDHISWDLQDRCEFWTVIGRSPRGLDKASHAYRFGGFGTHELVVYYELVRALLWSCQEQLAELAKLPDRLNSMAIGDFLASEIPRLERLREAWLDEPDPEYSGRTPRSIIERERARLPEAMSAEEAVIDPDCPCCQMAAEMPGPAFWGLDGCNMDDDFAFDMQYKTREEWEENQRKWEEHSRRFNAEWAERKRLGVTDEFDPDSIWQRSFAMDDGADVPLGIRLFGIGCRLAEFIARLRGDAGWEKAAPDTQAQIDRLNRAFGNLREILQNSDASLADALIDPVVDRFAETLATVATARPELAQQSEALTNEVRKLLDPSPDRAR